MKGSKEKLLFISWGGEEACEVGLWLERELKHRIPNLKIYISKQMRSGVIWQAELEKNLNEATHCLGVMTDVALNRPWFLFELGILYQRLKDVPLWRFCEPPKHDHPLSLFQIAEGDDFENLRQLATSLLAGQDEVNKKNSLDKIDSLNDGWHGLVGPIVRHHNETSRFRSAIASVNDIAMSPQLHKDLRSNVLLRELLTKTVAGLAVTLTSLHDRVFKIEKSLYPEYLIHLQTQFPDHRTYAVAVVDKIEEFWAGSTGDNILKATNQGSERIFVFRRHEDLKRYCEKIAHHAQKYGAYIMSVNSFGPLGWIYGITRDFSVIIDQESHCRISASYDDSGDTITFTASPGEIDRKLESFRRLRSASHKFDPDRYLHDSNSYEDELTNVAFLKASGDSLYHSSVIPIVRYDMFEEDHPYYREMHEQMLTVFREHAGQGRSVEVLEIGAGTGHFTKRLAQQLGNIKITAMEPDPKAWEILDRRLREMDVNIIEASALNYVPPGDFSFVFSSFCEHHIKPADKQLYFRKISQMMRNGGFLVVGDEFLSPCDENDETEYERALIAYHMFIIDLAQKAHHWEVAKLEEFAMNSGRADARCRVDFKISLERYLGFVRDAGFKLVTKTCISPLNVADSIGGIYVLVIEVPPNSSQEH